MRPFRTSASRYSALSSQLDDSADIENGSGAGGSVEMTAGDGAGLGTKIPAAVAKGMLTVKVLDLKGASFSLAVGLNWSVNKLKEEVERVSHVPEQLQRLIYRGRVMEHPKDLAFYKIEEGITIHLFARPAQMASAAPPPDRVVRQSVPNEGGSFQQPYTAFQPQILPFNSETDIMLMHARRIRLWSALILFVFSLGLLDSLATYARQATVSTAGDDDEAGDSDPTHRNKTEEFIRLISNVWGVYTGLLGMKASALLERRVVALYVRALVVLALLNVTYTVVHLVHIAQRGETVSSAGVHSKVTTSDVVADGLVSMMFAFFCWGICIFRAEQFRRSTDLNTMAVANANNVANPHGNNGHPPAAVRALTVARGPARGGSSNGGGALPNAAAADDLEAGEARARVMVMARAMNVHSPAPPPGPPAAAAAAAAAAVPPPAPALGSGGATTAAVPGSGDGVHH